jgi:hypothetical protein
MLVDLTHLCHWRFGFNSRSQASQVVVHHLLVERRLVLVNLLDGRTTLESQLLC